MVRVPLSVIFIVTLVASKSTDSARPKPSLGGGGLGLVFPQLSGWGWNPTTAPPETTTGWPAETTTAVPETTTGWSVDTTTGWSVETGWAAHATEIQIEMVGETGVFGEGEAGATHGSQTIVTGDAQNPAVANIQSGSYSSLGQGFGILQSSSISSTGDSSTFQGVDGYNFGDAGEYYGGGLSGNQINAVNGGGSFVVGQGGIGQGGYTQNSGVGLGWKGSK